MVNMFNVVKDALMGIDFLVGVAELIEFNEELKQIVKDSDLILKYYSDDLNVDMEMVKRCCR